MAHFKNPGMRRTKQKGMKEEKRRHIRSSVRRRATVQHITADSNHPPSLWFHIWVNIRCIGELMPRPIIPPSVSSELLGFVDEDEPCERRTRAVNGVCELLPNINAILRHHRHSERVPSDVDAIFCDPDQSLQRLEALPISGLYPFEILGGLQTRRKRDRSK